LFSTRKPYKLNKFKRYEGHKLAILYYLIKIYRTMEPRQQPVTEARSNGGRMNDIAGRHIRHAVEQDEREG